MTINTAPPTKTSEVPPNQASDDEDFGPCTIVIDNRRRGYEVVCDQPGVDEILVRNDFGLFVAVICEEHKQQHVKFYRRVNTMRGRRRRRQRR